MIRSGHINSIAYFTGIRERNEYFLSTSFSHSITCFLEWNFDSFRITDFRTTVARITQLLIRLVMNEKRREIFFFPPRDNNRLLLRAILSLSSARSGPSDSWIGGGEEIGGVSVSGEPRAWRRNLPPSPLLPPPHPPPCFARSNPSDCQWPRRNSRCNETPFSTSPPILYSRSFHADFFLRLVFSSSVENLGEGGGGGWMNVPMISYQKGGEGSTVIWSEFFFLFF